MLKLKPNCELCDRDLPPHSKEACMCSYECTFCSTCVETVLHNVCPNCGGGFVARPIRPHTEHRPSASLSHNPASTIRVHVKYSKDNISEFVNKLKNIKPEDR